MWMSLKESLDKAAKKREIRKELFVYLCTKFIDEESLLYSMLEAEGYDVMLPVYKITDYYGDNIPFIPSDYRQMFILLMDKLERNGIYTCEDLKVRLKEYEQMVEARIKKYNELKEQERILEKHDK